MSKRRGGQPGNKNAAGNRGNTRAHAPTGNQNAVTHGAYSRAMLGCMDDDEREVMQDDMGNLDPLEELTAHYRILQAAEIRLTKYVAKLRAEIGDASLLASSEKQTGTMGENVNLKTRRKTTPFEGIVKLEAEINKNSRLQTSTLQAIEEMRADRERMEQERGDTMTAEWLDVIIDA